MSTMSYDEAVGLLSSMFESWDRETLIEIFRGNDHHMERTIECILSMEGGGDIDPPQNPVNLSTQPPGPGGMETLLDYGYDNDPVLPILPSQSNRNGTIQQANNSPNRQSSYRGTKCILPDTFLRPPGFFALLADEQLALMLQDEMFRREVMTAMGSESVPIPNIRRAQDHTSPPDVGESIMKGLSTMGEGMKRQLTALATSFNAQRRRTRYGNVTDDASATNPMNEADSEKVPLTQIYREDDDFDSSEVINFDNSPGVSRNAHTLNDMTVERRPLMATGAKKEK